MLGLRQLGYVEGQNISWSLDGQKIRSIKSLLKAEFVPLNAEVIVTHGPAGVRAAKREPAVSPL